MIRRLIALLLFAGLAASAEAAQLPVTATAWVDLGAAPVIVSPYQGGDVYLLQAPAAPLTTALTGASRIGPSTAAAAQQMTFYGSNHVYAIAPPWNVWPVYVDVETFTTGSSTAPALASDGGALGHITNWPALTPDTSAGDLHATNQGVAQLHVDNGADGTGITPPTGGSGIRGWLSGIYQALTGNLNVKINAGPGSSAAAPLSVAGASSSTPAVTQSDTANISPVTNYGIYFQVTAVGGGIVVLCHADATCLNFAVNAIGPWTVNGKFSNVKVTGTTATITNIAALN